MAIALAASATPAQAQIRGDSAQTLRAGTQVRIEMSGTSHSGLLTHDLTLHRSDTAVIASCSTCADERYPMDSVSALYVRRSSTRAQHIRIGVVVGAVAGGIVGGVLSSHATIGPGHPNGSLIPLGALLGGAAGALGGGVIGAIAPAHDTWIRVDARVQQPGTV